MAPASIASGVLVSDDSVVIDSVSSSVVSPPIVHAESANAPASVRVRAAVIFFLVLSMMSSGFWEPPGLRP